MEAEEEAMADYEVWGGLGGGGGSSCCRECLGGGVLRAWASGPLAP
mgnify:CR=1 FL=1